MTTHMLKGAFGLFAVIALISPAWGDQPTGTYMTQSCGWSDPPVARAALALLKVGSTVQMYCKTCGDRMSTPVTITRSVVLATSTAMKQVNINGGMLDLALAYVQRKPNGPWLNLAKTTQCGTPTDNPDRLPQAILSQASPGAPPSWWQTMREAGGSEVAREPPDAAPTSTK